MRDWLNKVLADLQRGVRDREVFRRTLESGKVLREISEWFTIPESAFEDEVDAWERSLLAILAAWQGVDGKDRKLSTALVASFLGLRQEKREPAAESEDSGLPLNQITPALKDLLLQSDLLVAGATEDEIRELVQRTGGKLEQMSNRIAKIDVEKTLLRLFETGDFLDERGELLIRLSMTTDEGLAIIRERYRSLLALTEIYFGGLTTAFRDRDGRVRKAVIVFADSPRSVIEHERTHRDNPEVRIGNLGVSLNEGLTNYLAGQQLPEDDQPEAYPEEREMLAALPTHLVEALADRYQHKDLATARRTAFLLLDALGPKKYLALYRACPVMNYRPKLHERGYLPVTEVTHLLKV